MATGTLLFPPRIVALDANGVTLPGAKLYAYSVGTSTPLNTYSDVGLTTPNANPVVADAGGVFGPIYLSAASYKIVLKTSADVTVWTQDNVAAIGLSAISSTLNDICDGRLTLTSVTPVTTADVTAATTVYFTPYLGNRITLYDGSAWAIYNFSELSISLGSDAAATGYDVFAYLSAGAVAIERLAWTNLTTRATNLTTQDGVLVKSGDATRRYLGSYRTTGAAGQTEDSAAKRYVDSVCNRVPRALRRLEATGSWTYTTDVWRQANGAAANQVEVFVGWAGPVVTLSASHALSNTNVGVTGATSIGVDSTSAPSASARHTQGTTVVANSLVGASAGLCVFPAVGHHYFAWLERSTAGVGTTTFYGAQIYTQTGIDGTTEA